MKPLNGKAVGWPLIRRAEPEALALTKRVHGPWLAMLGPQFTGEVFGVGDVLVVDPDEGHARWIDNDGQEFRAPVPIKGCLFIPLSEFGLVATLYPHTRVVSFVKARLSRRAWAGPRVDRIRVSRILWDRVAAAVKSLNAEIQGAQSA